MVDTVADVTAFGFLAVLGLIGFGLFALAGGVILVSMFVAGNDMKDRISALFRGVNDASKDVAIRFELSKRFKLDAPNKDYMVLQGNRGALFWSLSWFTASENGSKAAAETVLECRHEEAMTRHIVIENTGDFILLDEASPGLREVLAPLWVEGGRIEVADRSAKWVFPGERLGETFLKKRLGVLGKITWDLAETHKTQPQSPF